MKEARKNFSQVGLIYAGMLLLVTSIQLVVVGVFNDYCPELIENDYWLYFIIAMAPTYIVGYPMVSYFMGKKEKTEIERRKLKLSDFLIFLCMTEAFIVIGSLMGTYVNGLITAITGIDIDFGLDDILLNSNLWVNILLAGIIGPIFEELLFRKLMIDNMVKYGEALAIVTSGFAFGLFHGNFSQFFYATMVGMLFGYVYVRTGDIKYSIILHMFVNLSSTLITPFYEENDVVFYSYTVIVYGMAIAGLILFFIKRKRMFVLPSKAEIPAGYRLNAVLVNFGAFSYVVVCLAVFVMSILSN